MHSIRSRRICQRILLREPAEPIPSCHPRRMRRSAPATLPLPDTSDQDLRRRGRPAREVQAELGAGVLGPLPNRCGDHRPRCRERIQPGVPPIRTRTSEAAHRGNRSEAPLRVVQCSRSRLEVRNDTAVQRRVHEGTKRPRRPSDCNGGLGSDQSSKPRPVGTPSTKSQRQTRYGSAPLK